jgi:hypothetical protein
MRDDSPNIERFIRDEIDSVPHLEALLLLWRNAPERWTGARLREKLYIPEGQGQSIAEDLYRRGLVRRDAGGSFYFDATDAELSRLVEAVGETYRRELIRISGIIHSKASPGIRAFADAFRFRKEKG